MADKAKLLFLSLILSVILSSPASPAAAEPAVSPEQLAGQVAAEINAYRQANGFSALPVNSSLADLATTQSEYQASIQSITHTGPGGTTPKERAASYGYGGGGPFFMSEIIYGGHGATPASAIGWWKNSALHNSVLLDKRYSELGAGVAYNGERVYFTVELAWTGNYIAYDGVGGDSAGNVGTAGSGSSSSTDSQSNIPADTIPDAITAPVTRADTNPDGSIVHIVQAGQDLWTIAAVYQVDLQVIYQLNGMNPGDYIYPGDEIIIQNPEILASPTPAMTKAPAPTITSLPPTATRVPEIGEAFSFAPNETPTPDPTMPVAAQPDQSAAVQPGGDRTALWIIISSGVIIMAAVFGSMFLARPPNSRLDSTRFKD